MADSAQRPPAQPPHWRENAQTFAARPICRSCAVEHGMTPAEIMAFPSVHTCAVAKCENMASYLAIA